MEQGSGEQVFALHIASVILPRQPHGLLIPRSGVTKKPRVAQRTPG